MTVIVFPLQSCKYCGFLIHSLSQNLLYSPSTLLGTAVYTCSSTMIKKCRYRLQMRRCDICEFSYSMLGLLQFVFSPEIANLVFWQEFAYHGTKITEQVVMFPLTFNFRKMKFVNKKSEEWKRACRSRFFISQNTQNLTFFSHLSHMT